MTMNAPFASGVDWAGLDGVIFDVDGTLVDHLAMRRPMIVKLLAAVLTQRMPLRDLRALHVFRKTRDSLAVEEAENIGQQQFEVVAKKLNRSPQEIEAIATVWMCEEPLNYVLRHAFSRTAAFMDALRRRGMRLGVFSDYPADGKLRALGLDVDVACHAGQSQIDRLKPRPEGFLHVAERLGVEPARCLVVGDRDDRDGAAAIRGGFPFLKKIAPGAPAVRGVFQDYNDLIAELEAACPADPRPTDRS